MTWATDRRLDFIDWHVAERGSIRREHLVTAFGVSLQQASADLTAFQSAHPAALVYDRSDKQYVPANGRYKRQRNSSWTRAIDWSRALRL